MFARINSLGLFGMESYPVEVEADVSFGMPRFDLVGLPDTAVTEARERVRSAMKNAGFRAPNGRITVNLAPADKKKEGPIYDLPVLIALLRADGQLTADLSGSAFIGELSLNGDVRKVNGALPMAIEAMRSGFRSFFVPEANAPECSVVKGLDVYPLKNLSQLIMHIKGIKLIEPTREEDFAGASPSAAEPDFAEVMGQAEAKYALEVAAAGGHNVMMIGPPGSGKSMLAKRIPSILPDMTFEESIETTKIYSVAGALPAGVTLIRKRPFRAPHHTISPAGLAGGGKNVPKPGDISLAHNGVLFLDELPEFNKQALEILRQPMEDGVINLTRASGTVSYACSVMTVCAMNPCPCGYYGHPTRQCTCPPGAAARYLHRVSGPLLDRLDIHIEVPPVNYEELSGKGSAEPSSAIRARVNAARKIQRERFEGTGISCNAKMTAAQTRRFCSLTPGADAMLAAAFDKLGLSGRAYDKILRVSRTIADLEGSENIEDSHVLSAIRFRSLDRKFWGR